MTFLPPAQFTGVSLSLVLFVLSMSLVMLISQSLLRFRGSSYCIEALISRVCLVLRFITYRVVHAKPNHLQLCLTVGLGQSTYCVHSYPAHISHILSLGCLQCNPIETPIYYVCRFEVCDAYTKSLLVILGSKGGFMSFGVTVPKVKRFALHFAVK